MNEDSKFYAASILKLAYLYYAQDKINQGEYTLDSNQVCPEVNSSLGPINQKVVVAYLKRR